MANGGGGSRGEREPPPVMKKPYDYKGNLVFIIHREWALHSRASRFRILPVQSEPRQLC